MGTLLKGRVPRVCVCVCVCVCECVWSFFVLISRCVNIPYDFYIVAA